MPIIQEPLGHGRIVWVGVNIGKGTFSSEKTELTIADNGIYDDTYRGMWREISGHDVDYVATDGVKRGDPVLNLRQITIVESVEVATAGNEIGLTLEPGMLRENIVVEYQSVEGTSFSKLPPLCRMVIGNESPKVLLFTEENGPCQTISGIIGLHFKRTDMIKPLREAFRGRRGQMAIVRSREPKQVKAGDTFRIFPPMT
jgi:MOSC domain-containing protein YiiM